MHDGSWRPRDRDCSWRSSDAWTQGTTWVPTKSTDDTGADSKEITSSASATASASASASASEAEPQSAKQHTGDDLQQTPDELLLNDELEKWLEETAWVRGFTANSRRPCWTHADTDEVVLQIPTKEQEAERSTRRNAVRRAAKILAADPVKAVPFALKLGLSVEQLSEEGARLEQADRNRRERATRHMPTLLARLNKHTA